MTMCGAARFVTEDGWPLQDAQQVGMGFSRATLTGPGHHWHADQMLDVRVPRFTLSLGSWK